MCPLSAYYLVGGCTSQLAPRCVCVCVCACLALVPFSAALAAIWSDCKGLRRAHPRHDQGQPARPALYGRTTAHTADACAVVDRASPRVLTLEHVGSPAWRWGGGLSLGRRHKSARNRLLLHKTDHFCQRARQPARCQSQSPEPVIHPARPALSCWRRRMRQAGRRASRKAGRKGSQGGRWLFVWAPLLFSLSPEAQPPRQTAPTDNTDVGQPRRLSQLAISQPPPASTAAAPPARVIPSPHES